MNLSALWMSAGAMGICLYLAFGLWQTGQRGQYEFKDTSRQIEVAQTQIKSIEALSSKSPVSIEESYQRLYETARGVAHLADAKFLVELVNLKDSQQVSDALMPSRFLGVKALSVKISFSEVVIPEGYIKILNSLDELQKVLPMEIKKIDGFDKNIEIAIDILGEPRRV